MMLYKFLALTIVVGVVVAEPLEKRTFSSSNEIVYTEYPGNELLVQPNTSLIIDVISSLIGYKGSALTIAVTAIEWIVSHFFVIIVGAAATLGFCKVTGKCTLDYEQYIPVTQLQGFATPENIESAEKFLLTAVEKYAEKRKRSA